MTTILSKKWDVPTGPAKGHLDTQLFEECAGEWCDRDVVKKHRRRKKINTNASSKKPDPRTRKICEAEGFEVWSVDGEMIRNDIDEEFSVSGKENVLIQRNGETLKLSLEQVYHLFQEKHERLNVLSLNKNTLSFEWKPLKYVVKHKTVDPLMLIKTRCGREMRVTRSHSCLTVDDDGNIVKIAPKDMEILRTFLPVMRGICETGSFEWEVGKHAHRAKKKPKDCRFHFDKIKLTRNFGFLIGIYLAEGCRNSHRGIPLGGINISATNPEIRSKCAEVAIELGLHPNSNNPTSVVFHHKQLADAIGEEFGEGSLNKKIPAWVITSPIEFREGVIDGYWSGDGSISLTNSGSSVCYASTDSKQLGHDIQALLASLGISSSVPYYKYRAKGFIKTHEDHWRITVAGPHIGKMPKFTHGEKEKRRLNAEARETGSPHSSIAVVPLPRNFTGGKLRYRGKKNYVTEELVLSTSKNDKLISLTKKLLWDAVVEIIPAEYEEFSYDLEIDENNTFVLANGIAVHNTNFGQHYRFKFIPKNEFWIDHEEASTEVRHYIAHLLVEYKEMDDGAEYDDAITKADTAEKKERKAEADEESDDDIHKSILGKTEDGVTVWEVDGSVVRDLHDIDWTEGGHDRVYDFVPANEVWIDDELNQHERPFVLIHELHERGLMGKGMDYEKAHQKSSNLEHKCRLDHSEADKALDDEGWGKLWKWHSSWNWVDPYKRHEKDRFSRGAAVLHRDLPSIDQTISSYANVYAAGAKNAQLVIDMVPEKSLEHFSLDGDKLAEKWRGAVERFFLIYPQQDHDKWSLVKTALVGVDWTSYPEAKRLCYSFLIPATVKCIRECMVSSDAERYVASNEANKWIPVESSLIKDVMYHASNGFMDIRLKDGKKFTFRDVSKEDYDTFMESPSKGKIFNKMRMDRKSVSSNWYLKVLNG